MSLIIRHRWLLLILAGAFLLRAGTAMGLQYLLDHHWHRQFLIEGDANGYWELGQRLAAGQSFEIYTPPRQVLRMPGFPLLLAFLIQLSGEKMLLARLGLAGVGTLGCWLVYRLGVSLFDQGVGLRAAALCAVSPALVVFSVEMLSETAFAATLVLSLWAMNGLLNSLRQPGPLRKNLLEAAAVGGSIALACYVRPSWLPVAPGLGLLLIGWRSAGVSLPRRVLLAGVLNLAVVVTLLPWAWRNHEVTGHWVFTTLWSGPSLYDGLNPTATGDSDMRFFDEENKLAEMSEYQVNRYYEQRAWQFVRANPGRTLQLAWLKQLRYWSPWPNAAQFDNPWLKLASLGWYLPVLVLSGLGAWQVRRQFWTLVLTLGPIIFFSLLHSLFVSSLRYRLPAEYPLYILMAVGIPFLRSRHSSG